MGVIKRKNVKAILKDILGDSPERLLMSACASLMSLIETSTPEGGLLIYMFGLRLGERIGKAVKDANPSMDPWEALIEINSYLQMADRLEVLEKTENGAMLLIRNAGIMGKRSKGGCSFLRGISAGFLSLLIGSFVLVEEAGCCGDGKCMLRVLISRAPAVVSSTARRSIIEYLRVNPGAYLRQMARDLGMSLGSLRWHLNVLERNGLVWERKKGNMTEFYLSEVI